MTCKTNKSFWKEMTKSLVYNCIGQALAQCAIASNSKKTALTFSPILSKCKNWCYDASIRNETKNL